MNTEQALALADKISAKTSDEMNKEELALCVLAGTYRLYKKVVEAKKK